MEDEIEITLTVNGEAMRTRVPTRQSLVDFLRYGLELAGRHVGCETGVCGACTVRLNGEIVRGCLVFAVQADGQSVETIEGASDSGELADLQTAFHERNALQCGYCTPGMLLTAQDLLGANPSPSREEIREALSDSNTPAPFAPRSTFRTRARLATPSNELPKSGRANE